MKIPTIHGESPIVYLAKEVNGRHWPFGKLKPFGYGAIIADPPWHYEMRSPKGHAKGPMAHYESMSDQEILELPVGLLAQRDCLLWLWATFPRLPFAIECMRAWGFPYVTGGAWDKGRIGTGYTLRSRAEAFLIGRFGDVQARLTDVPNLISSPAGRHSAKPIEARAIVMRMTPHAFRCELFAREEWPGNDVWGDEAPA